MSPKFREISPTSTVPCKKNDIVNGDKVSKGSVSTGQRGNTKYVLTGETQDGIEAGVERSTGRCLSLLSVERGVPEVNSAQGKKRLKLRPYGSRDSEVVTATRCEVDDPGIESLWAEISRPVQTNPEAHMISSTMSTRSFRG